MPDYDATNMQSAFDTLEQNDDSHSIVERMVDETPLLQDGSCRVNPDWLHEVVEIIISWEDKNEKARRFSELCDWMEEHNQGWPIRIMETVLTDKQLKDLVVERQKVVAARYRLDIKPVDRGSFGTQE